MFSASHVSMADDYSSYQFLSPNTGFSFFADGDANIAWLDSLPIKNEPAFTQIKSFLIDYYAGMRELNFEKFYRAYSFFSHFSLLPHPNDLLPWVCSQLPQLQLPQTPSNDPEPAVYSLSGWQFLQRFLSLCYLNPSISTIIATSEYWICHLSTGNVSPNLLSVPLNHLWQARKIDTLCKKYFDDEEDCGRLCQFIKDSGIKANALWIYVVPSFDEHDDLWLEPEKIDALYSQRRRRMRDLLLDSNISPSFREELDSEKKYEVWLPAVKECEIEDFLSPNEQAGLSAFKERLENIAGSLPELATQITDPSSPPYERLYIRKFFDENALAALIDFSKKPYDSSNPDQISSFAGVMHIALIREIEIDPQADLSTRFQRQDFFARVLSMLPPPDYLEQGILHTNTQKMFDLMIANECEILRLKQASENQSSSADDQAPQELAEECLLANQLLEENLNSDTCISHAFLETLMECLSNLETPCAITLDIHKTIVRLRIKIYEVIQKIKNEIATFWSEIYNPTTTIDQLITIRAKIYILLKVNETHFMIKGYPIGQINESIMSRIKAIQPEALAEFSIQDMQASLHQLASWYNADPNMPTTMKDDIREKHRRLRSLYKNGPLDAWEDYHFLLKNKFFSPTFDHSALFSDYSRVIKLNSQQALKTALTLLKSEEFMSIRGQWEWIEPLLKITQDWCHFLSADEFPMLNDPSDHSPEHPDVKKAAQILIDNIKIYFSSASYVDPTQLFDTPGFSLKRVWHYLQCDQDQHLSFHAYRFSVLLHHARKQNLQSTLLDDASKNRLGHFVLIKWTQHISSTKIQRAHKRVIILFECLRNAEKFTAALTKFAGIPADELQLNRDEQSLLLHKERFFQFIHCLFPQNSIRAVEIYHSLPFQYPPHSGEEFTFGDIFSKPKPSAPRSNQASGSGSTLVRPPSVIFPPAVVASNPPASRATSKGGGNPRRPKAI